MSITREQVDEIDRIVSSNEFWGLSSGEHQNMIDTLLEYIEQHAIQERLIELEYENERLKEMMLDEYGPGWTIEYARREKDKADGNT